MTYLADDVLCTVVKQLGISIPGRLHTVAVLLDAGAVGILYMCA